MKITFLGATKTVTGSNFLVEAAGKKFLVDCGLYQGVAEKEWENSEPFLFDVHAIIRPIKVKPVPNKKKRQRNSFFIKYKKN